MRKKSQRSELTEATLAAGPQLSGTHLERAGDHNQHVTLHAIRVNGPVTRTEFASMTGLTPAAIANIMKRLLKGADDSRGGTPARGARPAGDQARHQRRELLLGWTQYRPRPYQRRGAGFCRQRPCPAIAPVARAATSDAGPAVGAAILPFSDRFLPTRFALLKTT
jgi:hypothetical protein